MGDKTKYDLKAVEDVARRLGYGAGYGYPPSVLQIRHVDGGLPLISFDSAGPRVGPSSPTKCREALAAMDAIDAELAKRLPHGWYLAPDDGNVLWVGPGCFGRRNGLFIRPNTENTLADLHEIRDVVDHLISLEEGQVTP